MISEKDSVLYAPGDILIELDEGKNLIMHNLIRWAQEKSGYKNCNFIHAAIAISNTQLVEIASVGIDIENVNTLNKANIVRFRCKDTEVANYVADLAANLEGSKISQKFKDLIRTSPIEYAYSKAQQSVFKKGMPASLIEQQRQALINFNIPKELFCSELVIILYAYAYHHLDKEEKMDIEFISSPAELVDYLSNNKNFEKQSLNIALDKENVDSFNEDTKNKPSF